MLRRMLTIVVLLGIAPTAHAQRFVPQVDPAFPRIRFADSLTSMNDRCAVAKSKLNLRVRPVYVNGRPVGFC